MLTLTPQHTSSGTSVMIERYYFWMKITHSVPLRDHMPEVYSSPAGAAKVQCV